MFRVCGSRAYKWRVITGAASIGNIGPGFGLIGPMENYLAYSDPTTLLLALLMWVGRLEIFTVLILFTPAYWWK